MYIILHTLYKYEYDAWNDERQLNYHMHSNYFNEIVDCRLKSLNTRDSGGVSILYIHIMY